MKAMILSTRSLVELNSPRRISLRVRIEKNASTWFSQLAWGWSVVDKEPRVFG